MLQSSGGAAKLLIVLSVSCLFSLSSKAQTSQWTGPDASNNIYNNNNTGNVGIGTTTPRTNLEVNGYVHATTGISVGANTFSSNVPVNGITLTWLGAYGAFNVGSGSGFGWRFRTNQTDRLLITDATMTIPSSHVLVGTSTDNGNLLQVNGNLWATGVVLPTGAGAGKVLTSDASGNATWQTAAPLSGGWSLTGNTGLNPSTNFLGSTDNSTLAFRTGNSEHMRIDGSTGYVGIGTTTSQAPLEVAGPALGTSASNISEMARMSANNGNNGQIRFQQMRFASGTNWFTAGTLVQAYTDGVAQGYIEFNPNGNLDGIAFGQGVIETMRLLNTGQLLIGKTSQSSSGYMLDVNGSGRLNQVVVNATGADYVFDPGYRLSSLEQLEAYVRKEHHLPGISSATQIQQEGLNLGDNQTQLLAKIEELTLYLIGQNKEMQVLKDQQEKDTKALKDEQQKETQALEEKIKTLEERNRTLEDLEKRIEKLEHPDKTPATR